MWWVMEVDQGGWRVCRVCVLMSENEFVQMCVGAYTPPVIKFGEEQIR